MSRIGKWPIKILNGVTAEVKDTTVTVKGPKGELTQEIHPKISVEIKDDQVFVKRSSEDKESKSLHGLTRSLIANMVQGVHTGFEKRLEIIGVGYKVQTNGKEVNLNLGFSHPITYKVPEGITVEIDKDKKNVLIISGINKQVVGETAANIRAYRKPEPYKGKGIRYVDEYVARKVGKAVGKAE